MKKNECIHLFEKYLRNEANEQEKEQLAILLCKDKTMDYIFQKGIENAHSEWHSDIAEQIYANIQHSIRDEKKRSFIIPHWRKAAQWAAILFLPILSALIMYYATTSSSYPQKNAIVIVAPNGEKAEVTLADGSRVWINSGSSLTYKPDFNEKHRTVYLEGEAYFEVAKDTKRPFIVKTHEMDVQALGTVFNVRAYKNDEQYSAVLVEGKVKIDAIGHHTILYPNQRAILNKINHQLITDNVYASDFTEWKNGCLYFDNQSFDEIARTLSRIFNVEIRFASEKLRAIRFSGTLGNSSIRNALDILSLTSSMRYEMDGTTIKLYYKE